MNRSELQRLSQIRLAEATVLLAAGLYDGAYYLAGYSVECALKACIAKKTQRYDFPQKKSVDASYTHNLKDLVKIANLEQLRIEHAEQDSTFRTHWDAVQQWSEQSRYETGRGPLAGTLIRAIAERKHGVLSWIKRHW